MYHTWDFVLTAQRCVGELARSGGTKEVHMSVHSKERKKEKKELKKRRRRRNTTYTVTQLQIHRAARWPTRQLLSHAVPLWPPSWGQCASLAIAGLPLHHLWAEENEEPYVGDCHRSMRAVRQGAQWLLVWFMSYMGLSRTLSAFLWITPWVVQLYKLEFMLRK